MAKYRKRPVVVEATQWNGLGDHPAVEMLAPVGPCSAHALDEPCNACKSALRAHGFIRSLEGGQVVCPGDWIVTGVENEVYPVKPSVFEATYELVEE